MAQRYTEREEEVIWSLLCDGFTLTPIKRILEADEAGLGYPREIPTSSLKAIRRRLIAKRGQPAPIVQPDDEEKAVSSARRRLVTILTAEAKRLSVKYGTNGELEPKDRQALVQIEGKLAEIEGRKDKPAKSPRSKQGDAVAKGNQTREQDDPRSLSAIASRLREPAQEDTSEAKGTEGVEVLEAAA